jgi:hypothetical protein
MRLRCAGYVAMTEVLKEAYTSLVGKPVGYAPLGRGLGDLRITLREICEGWRWMEPTRHRISRQIAILAVLNPCVPLGECCFILLLSYTKREI